MPRTNIEITAQDKTKKAFSSVRHNVSGLKGAVTSLKGMLGGLGVALGAGAFAAFTKQTLDSADALGKTADRLGLTTEALQTLHFAATQSGMSTEMLEMSMQRFTRRMAEASSGTGVLKDTFKELGISIKDPNGRLRSAESILGDVADKMAAIPDQGERVKLAFKMFDSEGVKMVNILQGGSKNLAKMRKELIKTGAVMTDDFIDNAETANDALDKLSRSVKVGFSAAISGLAPVITDVADSMTDFIALCREYPTVTAMAGAISAIGISLALLGGPITIALAGITALIGGASWLNQKFKDQKDDAEKASIAVNKIGNSYNKVKDTVKEVAKETFDMNSENRRQQLQISNWMVKDKKEKAAKEIEIERKKFNEILSFAIQHVRNIIQLELQGVRGVQAALKSKKDSMRAWMKEKRVMDDEGMASIISNFERQKELVDGAYLGQLQRKDEHTKAMLKIDKAYDKAVLDLHLQRAAVIMGQASALAQELNSQGAMGFDAMKAFAIAEATINAYVAASKAWAQGGAFGAVSAGLTLAMAMAQVNAIKNQKPPKREFGGPVSKGKSFLVGERGPEMFTPNQSGNITPNNELGGVTNINFNIRANDARGFDALLQQRRGMIVSMINKSLNERGRRSII